MTAIPTLDTHVTLRSGDKILLSRRAGSFGHGRWHLPSGKLEDEPLPEGAARELHEETGVTADPAHLRMVHVVHHRQPEGMRVGFFFLATEWSGEPVNREPAKCLGLQWFDVGDLPENIIEYPAEGLRGYLAGANGLALHGW
jgi:ADP-ribose pyrophosphatase YjhB (NUDIX family)